MKKLKKFANISEYNAYISTCDDTCYPLVAYIADTHHTIINSGYEKKPLTLVMLSAGTITWSNVSGMQYRKNNDDDDWLSWPGSLPFAKDDKISFRRTTRTAYSYASRIQCSTPFNAEGNVLSIIDADFEGMTAVNVPLTSLFQNSAVVNAENLILPTTQKTIGIRFDHMFYGCTNLIYPPKAMKSTSDSSYVFGEMFYNCSNMVKAPKIYHPIGDGIELDRIFYGCPKVKRVDFGAIVPNTKQWDGGGPLLSGDGSNVPGTIDYLICDSCDGFISSTEIEPVGVNTNFNTVEVKKHNTQTKEYFGVEDYSEEDIDNYYEDEGITVNHTYWYVDRIDYDGGTYYLWVADEDGVDSNVFTNPYSPTAYAITEVSPSEITNVAQHNRQEIEYRIRTGGQPDYEQPIITYLSIDGEEYPSDMEEVIISA